MNSYKLSHLEQLEAEAIHIIREVAAEYSNPVMLFSVGKDSCVMLRLAEKAFAPGKVPFPLLQVDTLWEPAEIGQFRDDYIVKERGHKMIVHVHEDGYKEDFTPFKVGNNKHTHVMKTLGLRQALDKYRFDAAFGGARRDEERSRAKERIFSFRDDAHRWDPKNQRPELWSLYNTRVNDGESMRVFPLSNWTELDVWLYVYVNEIPLVPLYFAKKRPVVNRNGTWLYVADDRFELKPGETPEEKMVRFRTLGCYPSTGAVESEATDLTGILDEMVNSKYSERQGRLIDHEPGESMEEKKVQGYF